MARLTEDGGRRTKVPSSVFRLPSSRKDSTLSNPRTGIGIIGAGNIAGPYAKDLSTYPELELVGVTDLLPERAEQLAAQHDCRAYAGIDELLADDAIQLV